MSVVIRSTPGPAVAIVLVALAACGAPDVEPIDGGPALRTWLADTTSGAGVLVVQAELDQSLDGLEVPRPAVEGLSFKLAGEPAMELLGERRVVTWRWRGP